MTPWDRSKYPDDWEEVVSQVRERSGDRCEWCRARNREPHPKTGNMVTLTTAHVLDKRPEATSLDNLAHLCNRCHLRHDRGQHHMKADPSGNALQITLELEDDEQ